MYYFTVDAYQCGPQSYFTQNNGEIKSHGGYDIGHHYGKDLNCSWSIAAPVGFVVELVAENFTLEYGFSKYCVQPNILDLICKLCTLRLVHLSHALCASFCDPLMSVANRRR